VVVIGVQGMPTPFTGIAWWGLAGCPPMDTEPGTERDWSADFNDAFGEPESAVQARVWTEVLGDEYPAELAPYSYTTRSELAAIAAELQVGTGDLLVDIGSGRGGPGLWVTARTGADYLAVDISDTGLAEVGRRAEALDLGDRVRTASGSFESLPLGDGEAAAVMSIDALLFTPDKAAAARELARVLRPGGRLVVTTWDYHSQPAGRPPQVADHQPALTAAGFTVLTYDETPDWEHQMRELDRLMLEAVDELAAESDSDPAEVRAGLAEMDATIDTMLRRVLIVAERR
jgi:ubiquinone/menaquinone biosynthesis C-methylase UbiE